VRCLSLHDYEKGGQVYQRLVTGAAAFAKGQCELTVSGGADAEDGITFVNKYAQITPPEPGSWTPIAKKDTNLGITYDSFTFELFEMYVDPDDPGYLKPVGEATNDPEDGTVVFTPITYDLNSLGTHTYIMREIKGDYGGWTYDNREYKLEVLVEYVDGEIIVTTTSVWILDVSDGNSDYTPYTGDIVFYNEYKAASVELELVGKKNFVILGGSPTDKEFTFTASVMKDEEEIATTTGKATYAAGTGNSPTAITFTPEIKFEEAGEYTIVISENAPGDGWSADTTIYEILVSVTDYGSGALYARLYYDVINNDEYEITDFMEQFIIFTNTYKPVDASVTLEAIKDVIGQNLAFVEFEFGVYDKDGELVRTGKNDSDGKITFEPIPFDTVGDYEYTMKEIESSVPSGWWYDGLVYHVSIYIWDEDGELKSSIVYLDEGEEIEGLPVFRNEYKVDPVDIELQVYKEITNSAGAIISGFGTTEFKFTAVQVYDDEELEPVTGGYTGTGTRNGAGVVNISVKSLATGTYYFVITEDDLGTTGITYDKKAVVAKVVVEDLGDGSTNTIITYENGDNTFTNVYKPLSTTLELEATKVINIANGNPANKAFNFTVMRGATSVTTGTVNFAPSDGAGNKAITFANAITFTEVGKFTLTISESVPGSGWIAGTGSITIYVDVTDVNGQLVAKTYADSDYEDEIFSVDLADFLTFTNTYTSSSTTVSLSASKSVEGAIRQADQFSFELYDEDDVLLETVKNAANGVATFPTLTYVEVGIYKYKIKEVIPSPLPEGWDYDTSEFEVIVTVTDNGTGRLSASISYPDGVVSFTNIYEADSVKWAPVVTKEANKEMKIGQFEFGLFDSEDIQVASGSNVSSALTS